VFFDSLALALRGTDNTRRHRNRELSGCQPDCGEKYLDPANYETGLDGGDNETWCTGYNNDNFRLTIQPPLPDTYRVENTIVFGGAHPGVFYMSYCDGHVEAVSFDIDATIHRYQGHRCDSK
jgi:prepilin-type processing-associated H-X9-DG protein